MSSSNPAVATFNLEDVSGKYSKESDRACIALGAAELNAELGVLFQQRLDGDHRLLASDGPLGGISTRIRLAHALGWLSDEIRHDLGLVQRISDTMLELDGPAPFKCFLIAEWSGALKVGEMFFGSREVDGLDFCDGINPIPLPVGDLAAEAARRRFEVTVELLAKHIRALSSDALQ